MSTRPYSIAYRLILRLVVGLSFLSILLAALLYLFARGRFVAEFDDSLVSKARALASLVQQDAAGKLEFEFADEFMQEFQAGGGTEYFEIWRPDRTVLEKSRSLGDAHLPYIAGTLEAPQMRNQSLFNSPVRMAGVSFFPQLTDDAETALGKEDVNSSQSVTLVIASSTAQLTHSTRTLLLALGAGALLLPLFAAALVLWTIRKGLKPINDLASQVELISLENLRNQIQIAQTPVELQSIEAGINRLTDRLAASFEREQRFTTNVSHELKTPVAEALAALSMAGNWTDDAPLQAKARQDAVSALRGMQRLIETLFRLTRTQHPAADLQFVPVNPLTLVARCAERLQPLVVAHNIRLDIEPDDPALSIQSEPVFLECVLMNIMHNAVEYAPTESEVRIRVHSAPDCVSITCCNEAPGLTAEDATHLIEPFWRKDAARTNGDQHAGLGLSIADNMAKAIHAVLHIELQPANQLCVSLKLPVSTPSAPINSETGSRKQQLKPHS